MVAAPSEQLASAPGKGRPKIDLSRRERLHLAEGKVFPGRILDPRASVVFAIAREGEQGSGFVDLGEPRRFVTMKHLHDRIRQSA